MGRPQIKNHGFTLVELQVVLCIFLCLLVVARVAIWPIFQKSRQVDTMLAMNAVGEAMMSYLLDNQTVPLGPGQVIHTADYLQVLPADLTFLTPRYLTRIPVEDRWGQEIEYYFNDPQSPGFLQGRQIIFMIRSSGADGLFDTNSYLTGVYQSTDYGQDIVWADGQFVRRPGQ